MYDAIVVGTRCAGASTAMLLARAGLKVLLLERATFPADTVSGHVVKKPATALLDAWGLLDEVVATGCPPLREIRLDVGPFVLAGRAPRLPEVADAADADYAPRRYKLD